MATQIQPFSLLPRIVKPQTNLFSLTSPKALLNHRPKSQIPFSFKRNSGSDLASELSTEVAKTKTQMLEKEEALKKSTEMLFTEFCRYVSLREEEVKKQWKSMDEEQKWGLVRGFVSEWGVNFQPLSARSVKEMVEEYLREGNKGSKSSASVLFPGLKRLIRFSEKK